MAWLKRTRGRQTSRRRLSFERCEPRQLLAVTAVLDGSGNLTVTGDVNPDDVAIFGSANPGDGEVTIQGRNGTTVNGGASATITGVSGNLIANFGDGNSIINVDNLYLAGRLTIESGNGNDVVAFGATGVVSSAGDCTVNTRNGSDTFRAEDYKVFIGGRLEVHSARGADSISLIGASAQSSILVSGGGFPEGRNDFLLRGVTSGGQLQVQTQAPIVNLAIFTSAASDDVLVFCRSGQNSIYIDTCFSAQNISVNSFTSNTPFYPHNPPGPVAAPYNIDDTVTVARCQAAMLFVNTTGDANPSYLGGDDTVFIYGNNLVGPPVANPGAHVLSVKTGDGNDQVSASYNVVRGEAFVGLDELDDTLTLGGNLVTGFASADGGTGGNRLILSGNQFGGSSFTLFV